MIINVTYTDLDGVQTFERIGDRNQFALEYLSLGRAKPEWGIWQRFETYAAADDLLRAAQIADTRDGLSRVWRVVPILPAVD